MTGAGPGLAVKIDDRTKALEGAADNRDHQRKSERAGAAKDCGVPPTPIQSGRRGWCGRG
jgi:hypothetical protein